MFKPLPWCLFLAIAILSACGNKGELFLPSDLLLGGEVGVSGEIDEKTGSEEDELDADERVRRSEKRVVPSQLVR